MNFNEEMQVRLAAINQMMEAYLPAEEDFQKTLLEAMNYSMRVGGKRIRPMLMQETYRLFGGTGNVVEPFMAAIEMIHTQSLVHDDLPAIDNDEYRRGQKTTHVVYGEAIGVLTGDALLNYAYETAVKAFAMDTDAGKVGRALAVLAEKTGIHGMLGGQTVDVEAAGKPLSKEKLDFIYRLKTSALIESSMMIGALLADASEEEIEKIRRVGEDIGLAFQIRDDILDVSATMEELGKPILSDEKNAKTTYVSLEGIEKASADVATISNRALDTLDSLDVKNEFLSNLVLQMIERRK